MLIELEKGYSSEKLGNKGKFLSILKKDGFNVPDGFVLDSDSYDEFISASGINGIIEKYIADDAEEISGKISCLIDSKGTREVINRTLKGKLNENEAYAVRSSSTKEDLKSHSFAGQYETFLNVLGTENVVDAVIKCYKSLFSPTVLSYLANNGLSIDGLKMAVVIQRMVNSDYSGVAFTIDPISGNDKTIVIEAVKGLGESLVSGRAIPEQYRVNWYNGKISSDGGNLVNEEMLLEMKEVFLRIQMEFGYPCDIEFAVKYGKLYILQVRAVTRIGYSDIKDVWTTANFRDGGVSSYVCTPFMWSLYEYIWEDVLKKFVLDSKILKSEDVDKKVGEMFFGRPYWNLTTVRKAMSSVPGYKEREFDAEYGIKITYNGDGQTTGITLWSLIKAARIALAQKKILKQRNDNAERYKSELLSLWHEHFLNLSKYSCDEEFVRAWYRLTKKDYMYSESTYFRQIFINTIHQSLYKDGLLRYMSESDYLTLLGGIDDISHLLPFYQIWETTRKIRDNKDAKKYWEENTPEKINRELSEDKFFLSEVREFIEKFGYHSDRELDVTYPCYLEDTKTVVRMFRDGVMLDNSYSPVQDKERQHGQYLTQLKKIRNKVSRSKYKNILSKIENIKKMLWWREEFRDISTRFYCIIRLYTLKLAGILSADGTIEKPEDIWFLKVGMLWDYIDGKISAMKLREIIVRNKKYYNSFRNFTSENEIGCVFAKENKQTISEKDGFFGLGCNNGIETGVARVIERQEDMERLRQGDILVTKYTDTGWTCKFAMLSGIVTEYGGILCHSAIVSREYGIPCIVCAYNAMKKIKDGSIITINGTTGEIIIEKEDVN